MQTKIQFRYPDTNDYFSWSNINLDEYCPHCGHPGQPIVIHTQTAMLFENTYNIVGIFIQCPREDCGKFSVQAFPFEKANPSYLEISNVGKKIPYSFKPLLKNDLPEEVNEKFPEFKIIYDQSLEAECIGLDQISGIGFRKSLEFIIKAYAILKDPECKEKIEKETLNNTIQNRYSDFPKIQNLAKLASWIGNDETHFVKKHTQIDIDDMKRFIRSAALFIAADMDADFATTYIEEDKAKS